MTLKVTERILTLVSVLWALLQQPVVEIIHTYVVVSGRRVVVRHRSLSSHTECETSPIYICIDSSIMPFVCGPQKRVPLTLSVSS